MSETARIMAEGLGFKPDPRIETATREPLSPVVLRYLMERQWDTGPLSSASSTVGWVATEVDIRACRFSVSKAVSAMRATFMRKRREFIAKLYRGKYAHI